ncbi:hypothetical protein HYH03_007519 [Edaphochlamys debaryana]|uniref:FAD/NAD(P)-binding domain-containing protein n=1 Tax=Edaphochlamys debaryana TaxID=47281 RepID=A0A835Y3E8_9CHLO|nr:hypothetical protein HYH03_007519 [Edaphochlamys debaryana]|eukprot:KAG2494467.1 hypothetical protein HYH03_007519 [Edaphochlamys debaryana]
MQRLGLGRALGDWSGVNMLWGASRSGRSTAVRATSTQGATSSASSSATAHAPRVVVLGGGFGGLYAAVRLDQLMWPKGKKPQVTLVDQSERFVFKPLLYELIGGTATAEEVAPPFAQLLAPYPVRFVQAQVSSVETTAPGGASTSAPDEPPAAGHVMLSDGSSLPYDYLLVALGSQPDSRGVPGVRQWAVPFNSDEDALRVKGSLDLLADSGAAGTVVVVGGGYAGVELAAVLGERCRQRGGNVSVRLVTPGAEIMEGCPPGQREAANKALADLGVRLETGTRVVEVRGPEPADASAPDATQMPTACTLVLTTAPLAAALSEAEESLLPADLVVWTAGSSPATKEARRGFPFPTDDRGAVLTEPSLRVRGSERVFALGDVAVARTEGPGHHPQLPATAQVAFQQADYAAWNMWAAINGRPLLPFRYQHLGSMMSLGQTNAAVALPVPVPAPLADAVTQSPLGPLLSLAGVRLGSSAPASAAGPAAAVGADSGVTVEGPLAAILRRGAYLYRQPTNEQRLSVAASWLKQGLEAAASLAGGRPQ